MHWAFWLLGSGSARFSCRTLSNDNSNSANAVQSKPLIQNIDTVIESNLLIILQTCARVMLKDSDKEAYSKKLTNKQLSYLTKKSMHSIILTKSKKHTKCPYCGAINGPVKKGPGLLKILHEPFRGKKTTDPIMSNALGTPTETTLR